MEIFELVQGAIPIGVGRSGGQGRPPPPPSLPALGGVDTYEEESTEVAAAALGAKGVAV